MKRADVVKAAGVRRPFMWMFLGALALFGIVILVLKVVERRASKELDGDQEMSRILRERWERGDSSSGTPGDGGGAGF